MTVNVSLPEPGATEGEAAAAPVPAKRSKRGIMVALAASLAIGLGAGWIILPGARESTDDAYVEVDASQVAPRVRGFISKVLVTENRPVQAGDALFEIDPEEFDARLLDARATLVDAGAGVEAAQAALLSLKAEEQLALAEVTAVRTTVRAAKAEDDRAQADKVRFQHLAADGNASHSLAGRYTSEAVAAEQAVARVEAQLLVAEEKVALVRSRRAVLMAALDRATAQQNKAAAAVALAELDRRHTIIYAPVAGIAANRHGNVGDYVQPGSRLISIVPVAEAYVTAYFKETQVERMRAGQKVSISLDAGADLDGYVDSLAPGSGAQFGLLPFEPGNGNFTKIVQRVPVRIRFANPADLSGGLVRPGLSATVTVHLAD